jgi:hypothetical protein
MKISQTSQALRSDVGVWAANDPPILAWSFDDKPAAILRLKLKLTGFHGHLTVMEEGVRNAQTKAAIPRRISPTAH